MAGRDERISILHVDDDPAVADVTAAHLERQDERFNVRSTTDTEDALELIRQDPVDCVVSDYDMPDTGGIEFLESVRAEEPDLPFILYTGKGSEEIASEAISAGVTEYLQKETSTEQYAVLANRITQAVEASRSRRALSERTRRLETLIDNLPGIVYRCRNEPGWPTESVEGDVAEVTGYAAAALEKGEISLGDDVIHPDDREDVWATVQEALSAGDSFEVTYRIVTADGDTRWVWERGRGVDGADGDPDVIEGFVTDVTERRERERDLERERDRFVTLFEHLPNPVVHGTIGEEGPTVERVNPAFEDTFGYDAAEIVGENLDDLTVPDNRRDEARALNERVVDRGSIRTEVECLTADGPRNFLLSVVAREDRNGHREGYAIYTDITERKERERKLEARTRAIEETTDGIAIIEDDEYVYVNRAHAEMYGYGDPEAFLGESWTLCYDDDEIERFEREVLPEFTERGRWRGEAIGRRQDGSTFPQELSLTLLDDDRIVCVVRDIAERKERERELREKTRQLEAVLDTVSAAIFMKDADGRYLLMNDTCRELMGVDSDVDVTGVLDHELLPDHVADRYRRDDRLVLETGESVAVEEEVSTPEGTEVHLTRKSPIFDDDGEPYAVCAVSTDITDQKERERELERKNERLDEFASIVSHDLRNPLNVADGHLELARAECDSDHLDTVADALTRSQRIVEQTLSLARSGQTIGDTGSVNLGHLAEQSWENVATATAALRVEDPPTVEADPEKLRHLFENLYRNAVEHGGDDVTVRVGACNGGFYVEDDGAGLPADATDDVFASPLGNGDGDGGMGLAIVERIVEAHGWEIGATEARGGGARFEITGIDTRA